jgi:hypothetical protein
MHFINNSSRGKNQTVEVTTWKARKTQEKLTSPEVQVEKIPVTRGKQQAWPAAMQRWNTSKGEKPVPALRDCILWWISRHVSNMFLTWKVCMKTMHDKTICGNFPGPFQKLLNGVDITEGTSRKETEENQRSKDSLPLYGWAIWFQEACATNTLFT